MCVCGGVSCVHVYGVCVCVCVCACVCVHMYVCMCAHTVPADGGGGGGVEKHFQILYHLYLMHTCVLC